MRTTIIALTIIALPRVSWACATCFGAEGDPQTEGLNMAIITLLGVTYTLFSVMALIVFLKWRKNMKAVHEPQDLAPELDEGSPSHG